MKNKNAYLVLFTFLCFITPFLQLSTFYIAEQNVENSNYGKPILSDVIVDYYTVPGVSAAITSDQIVKIGILGDMNDITGIHSWNGAMLAAREINEAGGLLLNGSTYYIGFVSGNTDEANPMLNPGIGVTAAAAIVNNYKPHFFLGGFRYESLVSYSEYVLDKNITFISIGCPVDELCEKVSLYYSRYKYFFRVTPINTTALGLELISYISELIDYLNTTYSISQIKIGILQEDLTWTFYISNALYYFSSLHPEITIVDNIAMDIAASKLDVKSYIDYFQAAEAQIVIPLVSANLGDYIGQYYGELKPKFLLTGVNCHAQSDIYWDDTTGGSRYEILMQSIHNTAKTALTIPFWNSFYEEYGEEPYYTAVGSYDAVRLLADATVETQTFNSNSIVSNLESRDNANPFIGASGNIAFSNSHDIIEGWPYGTSLFCQWQMDGNKVTVPSWNTIYPDSIATGTLSMPYWGITDIIEDTSYKLPGNFTLTSDADDTDTDGNFNLSWTPSEGADNYSIYYSKDPITYISKRYTTLVDNYANSPYPTLNTESGDYFYVTVAYNQSGETFSNNVHVSIQIPGQTNIPGYNLLLIIPMFLFIILIIPKKIRKNNQ